MCLDPFLSINLDWFPFYHRNTKSEFFENISNILQILAVNLEPCKEYSISSWIPQLQREPWFPECLWTWTSSHWYVIYEFIKSPFKTSIEYRMLPYTKSDFGSIKVSTLDTDWQQLTFEAHLEKLCLKPGIFSAHVFHWAEKLIFTTASGNNWWKQMP